MEGDEYGTEDEQDHQNQQEPGLVAMQAGAGLSKKRKKKRTKSKAKNYEGPSLREHLLAGAYGGVAHPKEKRPGLKYTTDIDAGLRDIATPGILREAALPAGIGRKQLFPGGIQASLSGFEADG